MNKYRCSGCGFEVSTIPNFKEKECPEGIQHYFQKLETRGKKDEKQYKRIN